jgi:diadenosine tetraphosphate (Ap4A) HIT family hydrolase
VESSDQRIDDDLMDLCPFCGRIDVGNFEWENEGAVAFSDGFPVSPGHTLVLPRRHEANLFDLTESERIELWRLVDQVKVGLDEEFQPGGYNLGVNVGEVAGQTINHAHIHIIPRYEGDTPDPRGGVRWVFPEHAPYWSV